MCNERSQTLLLSTFLRYLRPSENDEGQPALRNTDAESIFRTTDPEAHSSMNILLEKHSMLRRIMHARDQLRSLKEIFNGHGIWIDRKKKFLEEDW